jgi:hypothetical protein
MPSENWGKTGISADVLNAIRNQASDHYKDYVPIVQPGTNDVFTVGNVILDHVDIRNEFLSVLPNVIKDDSYFQYDFVNPFEKFYYRGWAEEADVIQHIFVQGPDTVPYDIADSESFTQNYDPKVKTAYWYQRVKYQQNWSISYDELKMAFKNPAMMNNFLENLRRKSEYQKTVYTWELCQYMAFWLNSLNNITIITENSPNTVFNALIYRYYTSYNNTLYTSIASSDMVLILPRVVLNTFYILGYHITNIRDLFGFPLNFILIQPDNFANTINANIIEKFRENLITDIYLLCDRNTFNYYDTLDTTKVFDNPQTLKYNFTRNIRQIYGISPYATAIKGVIQSSQSEEGE